MPVLRFNRAIKLGKTLKVFLKLEGGFTRGVPPEERRRREQLREERIARRRSGQQRRLLAKKEREITRLKTKLSSLGGNPSRHPGGEPKTGAFPDFIIIGAQKAGTTFLYHLLSQHPNVEPATKKEVHYFDTGFGKGVDWYRSHFPQTEETAGEREETAGERVLTGEASPYYLYHPHAARRVAETVPGARLIVLLRDPVERAHSDYQHKAREGRDRLGFKGAIEIEEERLWGEREKMLEDESYQSPEYRRFSYLSRGVYVDQLKDWHGFFDREQLLVLKSEDLFKDLPGTFSRVLEFLGLPGWQPEVSDVRNEGDYEPLDPALRRQLEEYFEPHNRRLYEYLGVDFGW